MNVGFFFNDTGFSNIDIRHPENGNPGIGGTWYEMCLLLYYLPIYDGIDKVYCFHMDETNLLPAQCISKIIENVQVIPNAMDRYSINVVVLRNVISDANIFESNKKQFILWVHNFFSYDDLKKVSQYCYLKKVVFVGKEQYDRYIDHPLIKKSTYIYNMFSVPPNGNGRNEEYKHWVTYTGSLIEAKGFHILAKYWKEILKEVPDAELHVIGTGKVYHRNSQLGEYELSDEKYEQKFMPYLLDTNGEILSSVKFHGLLGQDKCRIYEKTAIGVVNPSAETETFCISAVEMSAMGIPIVTKRANGFLDTVPYNIAGLTYTREKNIKKMIIRLLKDNYLNRCLGEQGREYVAKQFNPKVISLKWRDVLLSNENICDAIELPLKNKWSKFKWLRIIIFYLRSIPGLSHIPSIQMTPRYIGSLTKRYVMKIIRRA